MSSPLVTSLNGLADPVGRGLFNTGARTDGWELDELELALERFPVVWVALRFFDLFGH